MLLHDEGPRRNHLGFLEVASTILPCSLRSLQGACRTEDLWCRLTEGVGGGGGRDPHSKDRPIYDTWC